MNLNKFTSSLSSSSKSYCMFSFYYYYYSLLLLLLLLLFPRSSEVKEFFKIVPNNKLIERSPLSSINLKNHFNKQKKQTLIFSSSQSPIHQWKYMKSKKKSNTSDSKMWKMMTNNKRRPFNLIWHYRSFHCTHYLAPLFWLMFNTTIGTITTIWMLQYYTTSTLTIKIINKDNNSFNYTKQFFNNNNNKQNNINSLSPSSSNVHYPLLFQLYLIIKIERESIYWFIGGDWIDYWYLIALVMVAFVFDAILIGWFVFYKWESNFDLASLYARIRTTRTTTIKQHKITKTRCSCSR